MKKLLLVLIAVAFVFSFSVPATAADLPKPVDKFFKGAIDVIKSPLEIYYHTKATIDESEHKPVGLFKGLLMSPFHVLKKAGNGLVNMVTCPIE